MVPHVSLASDEVDLADTPAAKAAEAVAKVRATSDDDEPAADAADGSEVLSEAESHHDHVRFDQTVRMTGVKPRAIGLRPLRRVGWRDPETDKDYVYLTNARHLAARTNLFFAQRRTDRHQRDARRSAAALEDVRRL